ncbi:hypothetical protein SAMN04488542_11561 [Fontibacillus panacisegetis]|uniref:Uncharacterized protein n=1 Tax=Fontibacillus panacisegetis TaxID=670482 RepID=A0A1G7N8E7_9BACL|nr:hypothetical protein [Fontibacillus panacisegetis]SDF70345.1 hypothetical protein SAMN04488542_11561 [Fontibacillus panacisegetis]
MACIQESEAARQKFVVNDLAHHWDHPDDEVIFPKKSIISNCPKFKYRGTKRLFFVSYRNGSLVYQIY